MGRASSLTKTIISQSALCTFASAFTLVTLGLCAKCRRTLKGTLTRILDILIYFRIRHSFVRLRPVILSADWSIHRLQSWTFSSLPTVAEFVKLTQSIVIEIQRQSADLYKVQLWLAIDNFLWCPQRFTW